MALNIVVSVIIFLITLLLSIPMAMLMKKTYNNEKNFLDFMLPIEKFIFKVCRINPAVEMNWKQYLSALLVIQIFWLVFSFVILLIQGELFLNPAHVPNMEWTLALNSAISFLTSTNLQHYSPESQASYLSQIAVFTFLQFLSAGISLAAGVAVVRGLSSGSTHSLGNFYHDFVKSCTRILLPLSVVAGIIFLFNGMPMTFKGPGQIITLQGDSSTVAMGPVASMIPIKELGANGGGFFGANCAHPFENPDFFTFIIHIIIVWLLPLAFIYFIGQYLHNKKFSRVLLGVMFAGLLVTVLPIIISEVKGNPEVASMGVNVSAGNMEGKECRFGSYYSALYSGINMAVPAGTIVGMHDSYMPLSAIGMMIGMQVDAFFGGLGTGWLNMFIYLVIAIFIATLMIGRTPEILGRKISIKEVQAAVLASIISFAVPLIFGAIACFTYTHSSSLGWLSNHGPHGFTTMLYEYISAMAGNGSEFSGLNNNTPFWNLTTCVPMLLGRFIPIIAAFIIVGSLREKTYLEASAGTLRTESATFGVFLFAVIMILTVLSMFIVFILGPIIENINLFGK